MRGILEFLDENGPRSPTKIKEEGPIPFSRQHINNRCMKLENYGLTQNIGNGVYTITEVGERYLKGNLDARENWKITRISEWNLSRTRDDPEVIRVIRLESPRASKTRTPPTTPRERPRTRPTARESRPHPSLDSQQQPTILSQEAPVLERHPRLPARRHVLDDHVDIGLDDVGVGLKLSGVL